MFGKNTSFSAPRIRSINEYPTDFMVSVGSIVAHNRISQTRVLRCERAKSHWNSSSQENSEKGTGTSHQPVVESTGQPLLVTPSILKSGKTPLLDSLYVEQKKQHESVSNFVPLKNASEKGFLQSLLREMVGGIVIAK